MNVYQDMDFRQFAKPQSVTASGVFGGAVDVENWKGTCAFVLNTDGITDTDSGASPAATVKLQTAADTGDTFTDISGATFAAIGAATDTYQAIALDLGTANKYVKAYCTIADETNATFTAGLIGVFRKTGM